MSQQSSWLYWKLCFVLFNIYLFILAVVYVTGWQSSPKEEIMYKSNSLDNNELRNRQFQDVCSQEMRKKMLETKCLENDIEKYTNKGRFVIDDKNKIAYCYTLKNGCSTWLTIMANISSQGQVKADISGDEIRENIHQGLTYHQSPDTPVFGLRYQESYTKNLDDYTKFLIARNPMSRLESGYNDKMQGNDPLFIDIAHKTAAFYDRVYKHSVTDVPRNPTFTEFIQMITDKKWIFHNPHFDNYFDDCNPCNIKYDYILKLETMDTDMEMFLKAAYGEHKFKYVTETNQNSHPDSIKTKNSQFSDDLSIFNNISTHLISKLKEIYEKEFTFYGYDFDKITNTGLCKYIINGKDEIRCC